MCGIIARDNVVRLSRCRFRDGEWWARAGKRMPWVGSSQARGTRLMWKDARVVEPWSGAKPDDASGSPDKNPCDGRRQNARDRMSRARDGRRRRRPFVIFVFICFNGGVKVQQQQCAPTGGSVDRQGRQGQEQRTHQKARMT
jgi:hypothetical protein